MKLIVGLGNPGRKYGGTRHNVGFEIVDLLAARHGAGWESAPRGIEALIARQRADALVFAKPLTFMNASGPAVAGLLQFFKIALPDLLVVLDDVNLEVGRMRARAAGSAGGHNGLKSIIGALGSHEFARLRVGVGGGEPRRELAGHVLGRFAAEERPIIADAVARSVDAAELFVSDGVAAVMNRFNRRDGKGDVEEDGNANAEKEDRD